MPGPEEGPEAGRTDPRSIITADAFTVAPELLGLPLARPRRRAAAMVVDLLLAAVLAAIGGLKLFIIAAALVIFRASLRRSAPTEPTPRASTRGPLQAAGSWALRGFALVLVILFLGLVFGRVAEFVGRPRITVGEEQDTVSFGLGDAPVLRHITSLQGSTTDSAARVHAGRIAEWIASRSADSAHRARTARLVLARVVEDPTHRAALRDALAPFLGDGSGTARADVQPPATTADTDTAIDARPPPEEPAAEAADTPSVEAADTPAALAPVSAYAAALEAGDSAAAERLRPEAEEALAGGRMRRLESANSELRAELEEAEEALERAQGRGLRSYIARLGDDLGVGFGWFAVYFTAFLVLWNGQTPGKRLFGVRVLRLDGKRLSWWVSFERFGGYAASLSTGLLGFLQILWDRNRQGLHDKAVGTVVVRVARQGRGEKAITPRPPAGASTAAPPAPRSEPLPPHSAPPDSRPRA